MKHCPICEKGSVMMGTRRLLRAHYNPVKRSRKYPNLQWARLPNGKRIKICTRCMKAGKHLKIKI
ncbi:50S ribosomal protein L28 [Candidatus Giovannonibacteria bacterium]|nr:50S ribosomal protein L28 [Candidatus Giovannonibacteria bacterium]